MKTAYLLRNLVLLALPFVAFSSFAQKKFLPGYVLTMQGDSVRGFIRYYGKYPDHSLYVQSLSDQQVAITFEKKFPDGIKGLKAGDDSFVRATVSVERSPKKTAKPELELETETVLLQILVEGAKSLYVYRDYNGRDNFYIKTDDTYQLLKYKEYEKITNGTIVAAKNMAFIDQLSTYLGDCGSMSTNIARARYVRSSLLKLFDRYYACTGKTGNYEKPARIRTEWNIVAGFSTTNLDFTSEKFQYLDKGNFGSSRNASAGIRFDFVFPKHRELLTLRNEFISSSYSTTGSYSYHINDNNQINYTSEFAYSYIKLNNLLQLNFSVKGFGIFLNAGISNGIALYEKNKATEEHIFLEQITVSEKNAIAATRKYEQGALLGVGLRVKRFSVEGRYEKGDGMSKVFRIRSNTERYFALLSYRISK